MARLWPKLRAPRRSALVVLGLLGFLLVGSALRFLWQDPFEAMPSPDSQVVAEIRTSIVEADRRLDHVILHSKSLGDIGFTVSIPESIPSQKLPLVLVLGGLGTGEHAIRQVSAPGEIAIVGYDWPLPVRISSGLSIIPELPKLRANVIATPAEIVSILHWVRDQPWADGRISLLGFSLGALVAPATQDMAERNNVVIGWTVIAYGGAPLGALLEGNPHIKPHWLRPALGRLANLLLRPLQPAWHLPHLKGRFLVLEGHDDTLISAEARQTLREGVPEPKTVILFDGDHMGVGPDKRALLEEIIAASRNWLTVSGAIGELSPDLRSAAAGH